MTAIPSPTSPPITPEPYTGGEPIGDILQRLDRPFPVRASGALGSTIGAFLTLGLYPLLHWPWRWGELIEEEQRDLVALAAWWRRRASPIDAEKMARAIEAAQPSSLLQAVPNILFWCQAVVFGATIFQRGFDIEYLWSITHGWNDAVHNFDSVHLHNLWLGGLFVAYGCHWIAVRRYCSAVRSFVKTVNHVAGPVAEQVDRSQIYGGLSLMWIIAAIVLCASSAWWGIPFALAGALQRRYVTVSPGVRAGLAQQVRAALGGAPVTGFAARPPTGALGLCRTRGCAARFPAGARFCPRCGAAVGQWTA